MLKRLLIKIIRYSGLPFLVRELIQRDKVTVVMFHDIAPEAAAQIFPWLAAKYNIIGLDDYLEARRHRNPALLPPKALIITLDDGHARNYDLLPVLRKWNIPVTIFLCSGIIDTKRHYWFKFKHPDISTEKLKQIPNREKLKILEQYGFRPDREFEQAQALNKTQIGEMTGIVNFQGHTAFHPCLPQCDDDEARDEIVLSKKTLEQDFQLRINALAFPNGDYSERDIAFIKSAGYECSLTVDFGYNTLDTDPFRLKRLSIDDKDDLDTVALKACGLWAFIKTRNGKRQDYGWSGGR